MSIRATHFTGADFTIFFINNQKFFTGGGNNYLQQRCKNLPREGTMKKLTVWVLSVGLCAMMSGVQVQAESRSASSAARGILPETSAMRSSSPNANCVLKKLVARQTLGREVARQTLGREVAQQTVGRELASQVKAKLVVWHIKAKLVVKTKLVALHKVFKQVARQK
jgi:hypothetical protein